MDIYSLSSIVHIKLLAILYKQNNDDEWGVILYYKNHMCKKYEIDLTTTSTATFTLFKTFMKTYNNESLLLFFSEEGGWWIKKKCVQCSDWRQIFSYERQNLSKVVKPFCGKTIDQRMHLSIFFFKIFDKFDPYFFDFQKSIFHYLNKAFQWLHFSTF